MWVGRLTVLGEGLDLRWVDHSNHSTLTMSHDAAVDPLGIRVLDAHCPCGRSLSWLGDVHGAGPERIGTWLASILEISKNDIMRAVGENEGDIVSYIGPDNFWVIVQATVGDLDLDCFRSGKAAESREGAQRVRDAFNHVDSRRSRPSFRILTLCLSQFDCGVRKNEKN